VVGFFKAEFGHGEAARRIAAAIGRADVPYSTVTMRAAHHRQQHEFAERSGPTSYPTNVVCLNPEHILEFAESGGRELLASRYTIGAWCWEGSRFPSSLRPALGLVDEIWVASDFVNGLFTAETDKSVLTFPMPVEPGEPPKLSRADVGLPEDRFVFLFVYDFFSTIERKNPLGLIDAFSRAFPPGTGPVLVLKSINGDTWRDDLARVREAAAVHPDIRVVDAFLPAEHVHALTAHADCYVSLHRSEGFGLTIADAMAYGKPAIATRYSGNLTFMDDANSYLVESGLATVPAGIPNYPAGTVWAEPNLDHAAELMRRVVEQPDEARERGEAARRTIVEHHSLEQTAEFAGRRLREVAGREPERAAAQTPAQLAEEFLVRGPSIPWDIPSSRLGRAGVPARNLLRRALRPYLLRQREWESDVVNALRQSEALAEQQQRRIDALARQLRELRGQLDFLEEQLYAKPYSVDGRIGAAGTGQEYRSFEDVFRGPEERIRGLLEPYVELLRGHEPVLDAGCGRGELLGLLRDAGIEARGVDSDPGMVERCREQGLAVEQADAVEYLRAQPDESLGAITAVHVIEHLPYEQLLELLALARTKLKPGGLFVAETVNPHSLQAFKTFWTDPTHRAPIFPEVAATLASVQGFVSVRILFPRGTGSDERDLTEQTEYALVATR